MKGKQKSNIRRFCLEKEKTYSINEQKKYKRSFFLFLSFSPVISLSFRVHFFFILSSLSSFFSFTSYSSSSSSVYMWEYFSKTTDAYTQNLLILDFWKYPIKAKKRRGNTTWRQLCSKFRQTSSLVIVEKEDEYWRSFVMWSNRRRYLRLEKRTQLESMWEKMLILIQRKCSANTPFPLQTTGIVFRSRFWRETIEMLHSRLYFSTWTTFAVR